MGADAESIRSTERACWGNDISMSHPYHDSRLRARLSSFPLVNLLPFLLHPSIRCVVHQPSAQFPKEGNVSPELVAHAVARPAD
jgi:hypothetical protein